MRKLTNFSCDASHSSHGRRESRPQAGAAACGGEASEEAAVVPPAEKFFGDDSVVPPGKDIGEPEMTTSLRGGTAHMGEDTHALTLHSMRMRAGKA